MKFTLDGRPVDAHEGELLVHALARNGVFVPTLCHDDKLDPYGGCRMCVVDVEGAPRPMPACATRVTQGMVKSLLFGFDSRRLMVRIDTEGNADAILRERGVDRIRFEFLRPSDLQLLVWGLPWGSPLVRIHRGGNGTVECPCELAIGRVIELAIPFEALGVACDDPLSFFVELSSGSSSLDRVPREGTIDMQVPSPDFERIMWQV